MALLLKTFKQFVSAGVAGYAAPLNISPALVAGDPVLGIFEGDASNCEFLQWQAQEVTNFARASSCEGPDLDSFFADFGFTRLPAQSASGQVVFSLSSPLPNAVQIPIGSVIQTSDGSIQYQIVADANQSAWNASLNAYVLAANSTSVTVTVEALVTGSASNVQAGQLIQFASTFPSLTSVTNPAGILNGKDAEEDDDFRARFVLWFNSRSCGLIASYLAAGFGVQQGLDINILSGIDQNGVSAPGQVTAVVDDGTGAPSSTLLTKVFNAMLAVRPLGIVLVVVGPSVVNLTAGLNIKVNPLAVTVTVQKNVSNAILNYINSLTLGEGLNLNKLIQLAFEADPNVVDVQIGSALINSSAQNISATGFQLLRSVLTSITVGLF